MSKRVIGFIPAEVELDDLVLRTPAPVAPVEEEKLAPAGDEAKDETPTGAPAEPETEKKTGVLGFLGLGKDKADEAPAEFE